MSIPAIRIENLSKSFGRGKNRVRAVDGISLEAARGQVYGFLGPNGAGKTTTIRMLLDLIRPQQGQCYILGQPVREQHTVLRRVGALVEGAAFYPYLSARRNLEVLARTADDYRPERIDALLEQVGLAARARQKVRGFSTGMKQRLGLAAALLSDPEVLILDEPTNGLDPAGMLEMRLFIREQAERFGKTVFLSSHLLNEVEQICDRVAIISRGKLLREGVVRDLLSTRSQVRIEAEPLDAARHLIAEQWPVSPATADGTQPGLVPALLVEAPRDAIPAMLRRLVENNVEVYHAAIQRQSLEAYFLDVTQTAGQAEQASQPTAEAQTEESSHA